MGLFFIMAERVGFEPTVPCSTPDFESGTIDHSATSPLEVEFYHNFLTLLDELMRRLIQVFLIVLIAACGGGGLPPVHEAGELVILTRQGPTTLSLIHI